MEILLLYICFIPITWGFLRLLDLLDGVYIIKNPQKDFLACVLWPGILLLTGVIVIADSVTILLTKRKL